MTQKTKKSPKRQVKFPILTLCIVAGVALMIGVGIGGNAGPAPVAAQNDSDSIGTPANEPVKEQPQNELVVEVKELTVEVEPLVVEVKELAVEAKEPLAVEMNKMKDSLVVEALVVSSNSGTVNIGGTHIHKPVVRVIEKIRVVKQPAPVRIWTRPGVPEDSRLGRTLLTLRRFEQAGVRIYVDTRK